MTLNDVNLLSEQTADELILNCQFAGQNCNWISIHTEKGLCHQLQPTDKQSNVMKSGQLVKRAGLNVSARFARTAFARIEKIKEAQNKLSF